MTSLSLDVEEALPDLADLDFREFDAALAGGGVVLLDEFHKAAAEGIDFRGGDLEIAENGTEGDLALVAIGDADVAGPGDDERPVNVEDHSTDSLQRLEAGRRCRWGWARGVGREPGSGRWGRGSRVGVEGRKVAGRRGN